DRLTNLNSELDIAVTQYLVQIIIDTITKDNSDVDVSELIDNCISSTYEQFFEILVRELITLFKISQLEEYKNLGIDIVTYITEDSVSCPVCSVKSGKVMLISKVIDEVINDGFRHAFCKYSIEPLVNKDNLNVELESKIN